MTKIFRTIGLMSGTSCDGIDAAYIETDGENFIKLGQGIYIPYEKDFSNELVELTKGHWQKLEEIEKEITLLHVKAVKKLLLEISKKPEDIDYLGFHGQTIAHDISIKYTKQIGDLALLAREAGIKTVGDFRTRDVMSGGQGAPLVPIFLKALASKKPAMFLNIGGVANITYVSDSELIGFDTGAGNALINDYIQIHFNKNYDDDGKIASLGKVDAKLLIQGISHPFFVAKFPKSLDRNVFNNFASSVSEKLEKSDAVATLTEFTVQGVKIAISQLPEKSNTLIVSGGGRKNSYIMQRLREVCEVDVVDIDTLGIDGDMLEAYAFGYLAVRSVLNLPISFPTTTNVQEPMCGGRVVGL